MDDGPITFGRDHHNEFQHVRIPAWAKNQPTVRVFARIFNSLRIINSMENVGIGDTVLAGRRVDLHIKYCTTKYRVSEQIRVLRVRPRTVGQN